MARILLTSETSDIGPLDVSGPAYVIAAKKYAVPRGLTVVPVDEVLSDPDRWLNIEGTQVVIGLSRLLTPSNRVRLGQALLRPRDGLRRVVVDDVLFVSEPWRAFWHAFATRIGYHGLTDSFLAETRWRAALEMQTEDPFGAEEILRIMGPHIVRRDPFLFGALVEDVGAVSVSVEEGYQAEKHAAFEEETTLAAILRRLKAWADQHAGPSEIPSPSSLFRSRRPGVEVRIRRSTLGVHRFLADRVRHVHAVTNAIGGAE